MSDCEKNYLVTISFLGSRYHGSQIQKNAVTVQSVFQNALYKTLNTTGLDIKCCSRTDSGVHAKSFCISFSFSGSISAFRFLSRMNHLLPEDIRVISITEVPDSFHARYSSIGKRYEYYIWNREVMSPFWEGRAFHERKPIDYQKMTNAAAVFVGTHDFSSFCSIKSDIEDKVRTVKGISLQEREKGLWVLSISADGFLYNMARIIAGALIQVNRDKLSVDDIEAYLNGRQRDNLLLTLPAHGLYLAEVFY